MDGKSEFGARRRMWKSHGLHLPGADFEVFLPRTWLASSLGLRSTVRRRLLTSEKYVVTTVRSANLRPAKACSAVRAESALSYLTKILPTPVDCRLPPLGRGTFISSTWPYFSHSSLMSSQISKVGKKN